MMAIAVALVVIGSMMNSNNKSNAGVLFVVVGVVLAFV